MTADVTSKPDDEHALLATAAAVGLWLGFLLAVALILLVPAIAATYVVVGSAPLLFGSQGGSGIIAIGFWIGTLVAAMLSYLLLQRTALGELAAREVGGGPGLPPTDRGS